MSQTKTSDRNYTYMRPETRKKIRFVAERERRSIVETCDVIADEALRSRGIDPKSLKSTKKPDHN